MARRFETDYRMKDGTTRLSQEYFNPVLADIDLRLHAQELVEKDWTAAVDTLNRFGLQRIDNYLAPAIDRVQNIIELGFLDCTSATPLTFEVGIKGVVVDAGNKRDLFVPSPFIAITRQANVTDYVVARVLVWDRETGALEFQILEAHGNAGPFTDLVIHALPGSVMAIQGYIDQVEAIKDQAEAARDQASGAVTAAQNAEALAEQARDAAVAARDTANAAAIVIAGGPVSSVNGQTGVVTITPATIGAATAATVDAALLAAKVNAYAYDDRSTLRSLTPTDGQTATVDGLGVFVFKVGSDEPDDDETCFATATGRWLIEAFHPDLADAINLPDVDFLQNQQILLGSVYQSSLSIYQGSQTFFTCQVVGAEVGDRVMVTPPAQIPSPLTVHAIATGANIVTIYINNANDTTNGVAGSLPAGIYRVTVFKEF